MSKPKISVILPVYNVEDYLTETLNSILNQSMIDDIEVIMVDDGSTDESRYIIEKYALDYDNFHAYHKENEGLPITRNFGLKHSNGEYIHFLDSDDYMPCDAYEKAYDFAVNNDSDILAFNVLRFANNNIWESILYKNSYNKLSTNLNSTTLADFNCLLWDTITCNKLFKRKFLDKNNLRFVNDRIYFEDILFSLEAYILADSISILNENLYYWRFRNDQSSITQNDSDVINFKDRLKILRMSLEIMDKYDVDESIRNYEFKKWLNHDLKFFLKRIDSFSSQYHETLIGEVIDIVKLIPSEIIETLNSYKQVLYKLILNNDLDNIVAFAPLEDSLCKNPEVPEFLSDEYKEYFNFKRDIEFEELDCELVDVTSDESNLFLDFEHSIYYLSADVKYTAASKLTDNEDEFSLEIDDSKNRIIIPFELLKDKNNFKVKITYQFDNFKKETYLKNRSMKIFEFENFDIDMGYGVNSYLYLDYKEKSNNKIEIDNVSFDDDAFTFKASSSSKINNMLLMNVRSHEKIYYPVDYSDSDLAFEFKIPYGDILNAAVKKWELNCPDCLNNVYISHKFKFINDIYTIEFFNARNKIYISNDLNASRKLLYDEFVQLEFENYNLKKENYSLTKKNSQLNERINEFKSRKVIKITDKVKDIL